MTRRMTRQPLIALATALLALTVHAPAAEAAATEGWYLYPNLVLSRTAPVGASGWHDIGNGATAIFQGDVSIATWNLSGAWPYSIKVKGQGNADAFDIQIGKINTTGAFKAAAPPIPLATGNGPQTIVTGSVQVSNFVIEEGERLALRIYNTPATKGGGNSVNLQVAVNDPASGVTAPSQMPTQPVPELPTLALATVGLVGLGLVAWRRR
ncbi:MAG TPA: hypothetical protein VM889_00380 [Candidatus Thermoplasmatota archaeon]|nr:hypothetical protein [Candidatus Thermoplasmatota archaeon]